MLNRLTVHGLQQRWVMAIVLALMLALLSACATSRRAEGEKRLNEWVGRTVAGTSLDSDELIEKKAFDAARMQYIIPDKSGCTISLIVDRQTKILLSWSYLREREKCWVSTSAL